MMNLRLWMGGLVLALVASNIGCNQSPGPAGAGANASNAHVQRVTLLTQYSTTGQDPLTIYQSDYSLLTRRIQASADDRWYLTSHKDGLDKQITHDLETVLSDVDDMSKIDMSQTASGAKLHNMLGSLHQDADRVAASVRAYIAQTAPTGHTESLTSVQHDLQTGQKHLVTMMHSKKPVGNATAKL